MGKKLSTDDWKPGDGGPEQGELLEAGMYECVIAEIPTYYRDRTWEGKTWREQTNHVTLQVDAVTKDGTPFYVTSPPGKIGLGEKNNLNVKFFKFLGLDEAKKSIREDPSGINGAFKGRGIAVYIGPSVPKGDDGIKYNNIAPDTLKWSDNDLKVADTFKTQFQMFPSSQYEDLEDYEKDHKNGDGDDNDLPAGF